MSPFPSRPVEFSSARQRRRLGVTDADGRFVVDGDPFSGIGYRFVGDDRYESFLVEEGRVVGPYVDELVGPGPLVDLAAQYDDEDSDWYDVNRDWWYHGRPFTGLATHVTNDHLHELTRVTEGNLIEQFTLHPSGRVASHQLDQRLDPQDDDGLELVRQLLSWHDDGSLARSSTMFSTRSSAAHADLGLAGDGTLVELRISAGYTDLRTRFADRLTMWAVHDLDFLTALSGSPERLTLDLAERAIEVIDRLSERDGLDPVRSLRIRLHPPQGAAVLERILDGRLAALDELQVGTRAMPGVDVLDRLLDFKRRQPAVEVTFDHTPLLPISDLDATARTLPYALYYANGYRDLVVAIGLRGLGHEPDLIEHLLAEPTLRFVADREQAVRDHVSRVRADVEVIDQRWSSRPDWLDDLVEHLDESDDQTPTP
jgi:hypothetical protein